MENKIFLRNVAVLVIPIALQNLINAAVSAADVIMLGRVSEYALSGASLGGQVQYIMMLIFFGLTSGASVLIAQYWGKKDMKSIEKVLGIAMRFAIVIGMLFTVAAFFFAEQIMYIYSNDAMVVSEGVKYIRIVCFSYIIFAFNMVYLNTMRSIERVVVSTVVYSISLVVNIIVNALLIFGLLGLPKLGVVGAAIGTLVARIIEFVIVLIYDRRFNKVLKFRLSYLFERDKVLLRDFIVFSIPVVINELMWGLGTSTNTGILGNLGASVSAASSVAQTLRQLATVVSFGIASAAAIMIGKVIGENKLKLAKEYGKRFIFLTLAAGVLGGLLILAVRPIVLAVFALEPLTKKYMSMMMFVMSYFVVGQAFNTTIIVGILRAGGDTKFGLFLDVSTMWCCSILIGYLAAFVWKLNVTVVYMILMSDEIIKIPISYMRYRSGKWLRNVTRD